MDNTRVLKILVVIVMTEDTITTSIGEKLDPIEYANKIMENPSGWWTSLDQNGVLSVSCHSFNYNEFIPDIENIRP